MSRRFVLFTSMAPMVAMGILWACIGTIERLPAQSSPSRVPSDLSGFADKPAAFVENAGQWHHDVLSKIRVGGMSVFVERNGWTIAIEEPHERRALRNTPADPPSRPDTPSRRGVGVKMRFVGATGAAVAISEGRLPGVHNYFLGDDPTKWRNDVPLHERVRLSNVWPGVDVVLRADAGCFEYDLIVALGVDLAEIAIDVAGSGGLRLTNDGDLVIDTPLGPVRQPAPRTWQVLDDGRKHALRCEFVLLGRERFGFRAPDRDRQLELIIDPGLIFSTFVGGSGDEYLNCVALDATSASTVAGACYSTQFPVTPGAYDTGANGTADVVVARLDPTGSALVYATYIGGSSEDEARALAIDGSGAVIVVGLTWSAAFPVTGGAYDTTHNGGKDAFALRLSTFGNSLLFSTFLGGSGADEARAVATDSTGAATIAGMTASSSFPTTPGAFDTAFNGSTSYYDVFVTRLASSGGSLVFSTFIGGGYGEEPRGIALGPPGMATVVGMTASSNFPTTPGSHDTSFNGALDAFVARLNGSGSALSYSTFLGGSGVEQANAVGVDLNGAAVVAGFTTSPNFPVSVAAFDATPNGGLDAFVTRLGFSGATLEFSTYLGGSGDDWGNGVALDASGAPSVAGYSYSTNLPTTPTAHDTSANGGADGFVAKLDPSGITLAYGTYLGGAQDDGAYSLAIDPSGAATVVGYTLSASFPTTPGSFDTSHNGYTDAFVIRVQTASPTSPFMALPGLQSVQVGGTYALTLVGPPGAAVALMFDPTAWSVPAPPYGVIGVSIPPSLVFDGIGLGFPSTAPTPLSIGTQGVLYFSHAPVPPGLAGLTYFAQAVAVDASLPGGVALSTHGDGSMATPACQVDVVP